MIENHWLEPEDQIKARVKAQEEALFNPNLPKYSELLKLNKQLRRQIIECWSKISEILSGYQLKHNLRLNATLLPLRFEETLQGFVITCISTSRTGKTFGQNTIKKVEVTITKNIYSQTIKTTALEHINSELLNITQEARKTWRELDTKDFVQALNAGLENELRYARSATITLEKLLQKEEIYPLKRAGVIATISSNYERKKGYVTNLELNIELPYTQAVSVNVFKGSRFFEQIAQSHPDQATIRLTLPQDPVVIEIVTPNYNFYAQITPQSWRDPQRNSFLTPQTFQVETNPLVFRTMDDFLNSNQEILELVNHVDNEGLAKDTQRRAAIEQILIREIPSLMTEDKDKPKKKKKNDQQPYLAKFIELMEIARMMLGIQLQTTMADSWVMRFLKTESDLAELVAEQAELNDTLTYGEPEFSDTIPDANSTTLKRENRIPLTADKERKLKSDLDAVEKEIDNYMTFFKLIAQLQTETKNPLAAAIQDIEAILSIPNQNEFRQTVISRFSRGSGAANRRSFKRQLNTLEEMWQKIHHPDHDREFRNADLDFSW